MGGLEFRVWGLFMVWGFGGLGFGRLGFRVVGPTAVAKV